MSIKESFVQRFLHYITVFFSTFCDTFMTILKSPVIVYREIALERYELVEVLHHKLSEFFRKTYYDSQDKTERVVKLSQWFKEEIYAIDFTSFVLRKYEQIPIRSFQGACKAIAELLKFAANPNRPFYGYDDENWEKFIDILYHELLNEFKRQYVVRTCEKTATTVSVEESKEETQEDTPEKAYPFVNKMASLLKECYNAATCNNAPEDQARKLFFMDIHRLIQTFLELPNYPRYADLDHENFEEQGELHECTASLLQITAQFHSQPWDSKTYTWDGYHMDIERMQLNIWDILKDTHDVTESEDSNE